MGFFSSVVGVADSLTGGWISDSGSKSSAKRQYKYNERLQDQNQDFQKYMAENAHQMEMADLQEAGLNPALTVTGSSAGSIAGSSAAQGTSTGSPMADLSSIIQNINATRMTNADVKQKNAQTKFIPQQINNETTSAKANLINAEANRTNAETQRKVAEEGAGGKFFGIENGGLLSSIATALLPTAGLGIAGLGLKGYKAFKAAKTAKGFGNFIKSVSSAK